MKVILEVAVKFHHVKVNVRRLKIHNIVFGRAQKLVGIRVAGVGVSGVTCLRCWILERSGVSAEIYMVVGLILQVPVALMPIAASKLHLVPSFGLGQVLVQVGDNSRNSVLVESASLCGQAGCNLRKAVFAKVVGQSELRFKVGMRPRSAGKVVLTQPLLA